MENQFINFADLYEHLANTIERLPDDKMGSAIGSYFGKTQGIGRTTRMDMQEKKGWEIKDTINGYSATRRESKEEKELKEKIYKLQKRLNEIQNPPQLFK
jgi:hypothetical protein